MERQSTRPLAGWFIERSSTGLGGVNIGSPVSNEHFSFDGISDSTWAPQLDITGEGVVEFFAWRLRTRCVGGKSQMGFSHPNKLNRICFVKSHYAGKHKEEGAIDKICVYY